MKFRASLSAMSFQISNLPEPKKKFFFFQAPGFLLEKCIIGVMEVGRGVPKTAELTLHEKTSLGRFYKEAMRQWQEKKVTYNFPDKLSEDFIMVKWMRTGYQSIEVPEFSLDFLSDYGSIRLDGWIVNPEKREMVVSNSLYTLGPEGKTRGKGKSGLKALHAIIQRLANETGFTIYDVATPNQKSSTLLSQEEGYELLDELKEGLIWNIAHSDSNDRFRLKTLMRSATPYDSRIKKYSPRQKQVLTKRQSWEMGIIKQLAYF